ncbi:uroporphyrinogen-III synthase [Synechococcus sp. RSCCF101]|uniref:uroporphyrinogen-III synthase n=1 Tax=Synechococcus sp. RSCCF101 TaxID=2511069 RepID=UPI0012476160|nr:uroporphyrinogen-III synthase [Synechococcus sp. RSCCF101]QEY32916.1 uroporphyrinogen-III synthase [Synechococcus sp. RSCCF101]
MTRPLIGVTRAAGQLSQARRLFEAAGADVLDLPALEIGPPDSWGPLDDALAEWDQFHWILFSSANGVEAVEARLARQGRSLSRRPRGLRLAAVGRRTAEVLEAQGAAADFVPADFVADSLIDTFPVSGFGLRMLLPRVQSGGRTLLAEAFGEAGARVVEVAAYESRCPRAWPEATVTVLREGALAAITFSSGKTVRHSVALLQQHFGEHWREPLRDTALVSIGPQTSRTCRELLGEPDAEADPHDLNGLLAACRRATPHRDWGSAAGGGG